MTHYTITEPHPTVVQNHYTHAGRGGAGNYFRAPATTPSSGIPTELTPSTSRPSTTTTTRFYSGRGGAGNSHVTAKPPALSLDEAYQQHAHLEAKAVGHVGRGGAGNVYDHSSRTGSTRKASDASSRASSSSSSSGRSARLFERLSKTLSRNH